jgi:hypothetical protein
MGITDAIGEGYNLLASIASLSPLPHQIATTMGLLGRIPEDIRGVLLSSLNEEMLEKIASWSTTFVEELNRLPNCSPISLRRLVDPTLDTEFFEVMARVGLDVPLLDAADLAEVNNAMTKAVKAENWKEAIGVALSIAGNVIPVK